MNLNAPSVFNNSETIYIWLSLHHELCDSAVISNFAYTETGFYHRIAIIFLYDLKKCISLHIQYIFIKLFIDLHNTKKKDDNNLPYICIYAVHI